MPLQIIFLTNVVGENGSHIPKKSWSKILKEMFLEFNMNG